MRTTEMVLFAPFLKTSKFLPACMSIYILSLIPLYICVFYSLWSKRHIIRRTQIC